MCYDFDYVEEGGMEFNMRVSDEVDMLDESQEVSER